ncbi:type III-A CRISPR-associated protein Cas10/Csm1 [Thermoanaerobacterium sp. RBIITD]|uniref:type III-A CRISPR-associated protein Cas10/Csm1 n=1 Tax=Thermoanaerobacterium sp. RBIITD TaxID=1550240 RepID=UPI000BB89C36|nr:type III-A CRISPR-associated protein Cas10/Csm1 [Thermoanaerobacterium sp. RBIITD]SNX53623.1 CRISPR-associated protein Csm1 [Thermoanaerobacterium sp. RBIITD]
MSEKNNLLSEEEYILVLSSLLHDIGKFWQRTKDKEVLKTLKENYRVFYSEEGAYAPRHQEWSAYFCEKHNLKKELMIVRNHHKPSNKLEYIISTADRLSSGERERHEENDEIKQMVSVFSNICLDNNKKIDEFYKKLEPFSMLTYPSKDIGENIESGYNDLWNKFEKQFDELKTLEDDCELEKLYNLLEEYTSNIPSAFYYSKPDISLFSHLKTTAALAISIYRQFQNLSDNDVINTCKKLTKENIKDAFCLVKGDISGIQDFVYDTDMDGAIKALRGKSFYISYLLNAFSKYILRKERLPLCNLLYSGGGHFYLIMPGYFINKIEYYQREFDEILYKAHSGRLALLIDTVSVSSGDFKNFSKKFTEVSNKLQDKKNKKFYMIIENDEGEIFKPIEEEGNSCPHCGRIIKNDECDYCNSFKELGEKIIRYKFLTEIWGKPSIKNAVMSWEDVFNEIGLDVKFTNGAENGPCYTINSDINFDVKTCGSLKVPSNMDINEGKIKSFDEISQSAKGLKLWGVIRGDVDNLGKIFGVGLGDNNSISRTSTLSQELSQFFGVSLEKIIKINNKIDNCYVIYAGGDDFFIVGRWDKLPYLALLIKQEFTRYTCNNPSITISMSFAIAPDKKFPLFRVADAAGEYLDDAKEYERNGIKKDAFSFSGRAIGWEEFDEFESLKSIIVNALDNRVSRSLLGYIYEVCDNWNYSQAKSQIFKSWRLIYNLSRLRERHRHSEKLINELIYKILVKGNKLYKNTYWAARWAEFETRDNRMGE